MFVPKAECWIKENLLDAVQTNNGLGLEGNITIYYEITLRIDVNLLENRYKFMIILLWLDNVAKVGYVKRNN